MIKLCNVVSYNKNTHIILALFDGKQIQFATDKNDVSGSIYVEKTKDGFKVVDEDQYSKSLKPKREVFKAECAENIVD